MRVILVSVVLAALVVTSQAHGYRPGPRNRHFYYKDCLELQKLQDEAYDEFKVYAAAFESQGFGNLDDFFKYRCNPKTTTRRTTRTPVTTTPRSNGLEELAADAYKQIINTKDRINAGNDSLAEVNGLVDNLTDECSEIKRLMPGGISSVPNPSKILVDTVGVCNLILNTGIPQDNNDLDKYIDALSKL